MPQATIALWIGQLGVSAGTAAFMATVAQTILINIALSSHEFFDENGEPYIAVDD